MKKNWWVRTISCLTKILAIERIIQRNPKGITTQMIIDKLDNQYGIKADRKSIYNNINVLTRFMPIYIYKQNQQVFYCLREDEYK